jgi:hypothetical protein
MKPATRMLKLNTDTNVYEYDHTEMGHIQNLVPPNWRKQFGYLDDNNQFQPMRV